MTIERLGKMKIRKKSQKSEVKAKYRIAQRYLVNTPLTLEDWWAHEKLRYTYISLVQSIAGEQELDALHSSTTMNALNDFFLVFRKQLRRKILEHVEVDDIISKLERKIYDDYTEEIVADIDAYMDKKEITGAFLRMTDLWDDFEDAFDEDFIESVKNALIHAPPDLSDEWIALERKMNNYLTTKKGNPIILFEKIRNIQHINGYLLEDLIDIPGTYSNPLWKNSDDILKAKERWKKSHPESLVMRHGEYVYQFPSQYDIFMDLLSEDAFQFTMPYRFGYDGKEGQA
jgi:hypothetical protein